jgi:hypothetical protein
LGLANAGTEESAGDWVVLVVVEPDAEGWVLLLKAELVERRYLIIVVGIVVHLHEVKIVSTNVDDSLCLKRQYKTCCIFTP